MLKPAAYRGRFAPSPTGPLHFGSLITALGSFLEARQNNGTWLVRIEDLDPPRCMPGAAEGILRTLECYGFEWDDEIVYQSQRFEHYEHVLNTLKLQKRTYPCRCSRKEIIERCNQGQYGAIYDGFCRDASYQVDNSQAYSIRLQVTSEIQFKDGLQGLFRQDLKNNIGDFHLKRRDGLYAYHLGVVVDDHLQGITDIVRGFDLLDSTPRQIFLQQTLNYSTPNYLHLPLAIKQDGDKLSKQNLATPLDNQSRELSLWNALMFLGQAPPNSLQKESLNTIWQWALEYWDKQLIPKKQKVLSPIL